MLSILLLIPVLGLILILIIILILPISEEKFSKFSLLAYFIKLVNNINTKLIKNKLIR